jgi:heavy metal sensor kinase
MRLLPRSIRWRLQLWHGALLLVVLASFGFTSFLLVRESRLRRVDQELLRRVAVLATSIRPPGHRDGFRDGPRERGPEGPGERAPGAPRPGRAPGGQVRPAPLRPDGLPGLPAPGSPPDVLLSPAQEMLFQAGEGPDAGYYFAVFSPAGTVIRRSANAPVLVSAPTGSFVDEYFRTDGERRERASRGRGGFGIVVGRSVAPDLAELRRLAVWLAVAAAGVLTLGLAGGGWVTTRAIRPINAISAAAQKIAGGAMDERIGLDETDSELGRLAQVLNATFDRLCEAFARQARFTADASHELRTPVAVILAQTETILARERTPAEYREAIEACRRAAQRLRHLTEALLTLARLDSGAAEAAPEPVPLDRIAADALDLLRPLAAERSVRIETDLVPVLCRGRAVQLAQVAANLVSNAIHYNRPGGAVAVRTTREGGGAVLTVRDTGPGIAEADLPHIFERFYRADASRARADGRTGLGLAIVKAILDTHGGTVAVESRRDEGSVFTVRLPLADAHGRTGDDGAVPGTDSRLVG